MIYTTWCNGIWGLKCKSLSQSQILHIVLEGGSDVDGTLKQENEKFSPWKGPKFCSGSHTCTIRICILILLHNILVPAHYLACYLEEEASLFL
jgi:hypothetical protein